MEDKNKKDLNEYIKLTSKECILFVRDNKTFPNRHIKIFDDKMNYFCVMDFDNDTFKEISKSPYFKRKEDDYTLFYFSSVNVAAIQSYDNQRIHTKELINLLAKRKKHSSIKQETCLRCNYDEFENVKIKNINLKICKKCGKINT